MKPLEYWSKGVINTILMSTWFMDFLDPAIKSVATLAGIILSIVLIRKAWHDTELAKEKKRGEKLLNDMKEQELYAKIANNKKRFG